MNTDCIPPALLAAASDQPAALVEPARFGNFTLVWMVLVGSAGCALLLWCLGPDRQRRAIDRLGDRPYLSLLAGAALLAVLGVAVVAAYRAGWSGRGGGMTTILPAMLAAGAGLGVVARWLGERALPDAGPGAQVVLGLAAVILPGIALVGLPITILAAALGLGAWLRAARA